MLRKRFVCSALFCVIVKNFVGNKDFVIGRNFKIVFVVSFVKERAHTQAVRRIHAVLRVLCPIGNVASL